MHTQCRRSTPGQEAQCVLEASELLPGAGSWCSRHHGRALPVVHTVSCPLLRVLSQGKPTALLELQALSSPSQKTSDVNL